MPLVIDPLLMPPPTLCHLITRRADFNTVQALVRYLYTSDIEYMDHEDVRGATLDDGWLRVEPCSGGREDMLRGEHLPVWEWRSLEQIESGEGSPVLAMSAAPEQEPAADERGEAHGTSSSLHGRRSASYTEASSSSSINARHLSRDYHVSDGLVTSPGGFNGKGKAKADGHDAAGAAQDDAMGHADGATPYRSALIAALRADPHPHPAPRTCGAPALAMYRLAHRYTEPNLAVLSKTHIMGTLTPSSAFPVLLATNLYAEVHHSVHQYVLDHWDTVAATEEFERCCDEVSMGEVSKRVCHICAAVVPFADIRLHISFFNPRSTAVGSRRWQSTADLYAFLGFPSAQGQCEQDRSQSLMPRHARAGHVRDGQAHVSLE